MAGSLLCVKVEVETFCETRKSFAPIACHLERRASARRSDGNFTVDERLDVYKQRRIDPEMASEFSGQVDRDFSIPSKNEGN